MCTACGGGQGWYLEMKNYAEVLLHQELSAEQRQIVRAPTRLEWNRRLWENFVVPAATGVPATVGFMTGISLSEPAPDRLRGPIVVGRHVALN